MSSFTHLHTHSHFSLLQAIPKIPELVSAAVADGQDALALTDAGNLYGAIQFYQECEKNDIKPIIGVDGYLALRSRTDKQAGVDKGWNRIVLLAKNRNGYTNLINLVTRSFLEGFYYKPRMDHELLAEYADDLIVIIPSFSGDVAKAIAGNDTARAHELLASYKQTFGADNVYIEIARHPEIEGHDENMEQLIAFARETDTPLVAAQDVYYLSPDDKRARDVLLAVQSSRPVSASDADDQSEDFSFITQNEIQKRFSDIPDAIENTQLIKDRCNLELELGSWVFPDIDVPSGKNYNDELRDQAYKGIERRGMERSEEVINRLEYELKVIRDKGYSSYFLIVGDLLRHAHKSGIQTTIRGSVAGSITTYLLGITNVDPLAYKLPFERFLNPERPKAPDIDMDFADDRRDDMLAYAREKYGHDKVAQIGTFGTMLARGAVRDVARALGYPYSDGDRIAKLIPFGSQGFQMTIERALSEEPDLKQLYDSDNDARDILDMAQKIEGCARHISVHAAGVVIAPDPLTNYVPLQYDPKGGKLITQFDMHEVEDAGLVKFDFLGIRNLSILANAVEQAKQRYGIEIDIENIPLDDPKAFNLVAKGETTGLFQLSGEAMTQHLMHLKPSTIHDINAMVALYRPGPMEYIPAYIERKHDPSKVTYLDDRLKPLLEQSYGIIAYQDDVLMIAVELAGFSWLEADKLRKAMGKKIPEEMEKQKEKLLSGLQKHSGMSEDIANKLWKQIEPFAAYGFNKAHAASYGKVAYQTAYMKANYPAAFMTAVLTAESGDTDKIAQIVPECSRIGIEVLPPDINQSRGDFTIVEDINGNEQIRFGLCTIKNVGEGIAERIIEERDANGAFASLADFLHRVRDRNLNKKTLEALIKTGALDELEIDRGVLLANLENLILYNREAQKESDAQESLFGGISDGSAPDLRLEEAPLADKQEKLTWEKELIGLYISGHPLDHHKEKLKDKRTISDLRDEGINNQTVVLGALIEEKKEIFTKKGDRMAFLKLGDQTGSIEAVIFPSAYPTYRALLEPDCCVAVKGKLSYRNDEISILIDKAKRLDGTTAAELTEPESIITEAKEEE